ncbi:MAG: flavodoxin family protein [Candidatus Zipacnadales bacterium]
MNLVAIMGSPHGMKGNTGTLLSALLEGAKEAGAETTIHSLSDLYVAPCRACNVCHKTGECSISDGFQEIRRTMLEAEAIVFASPNYIQSVTAQLKALFDRLCGPLHLQQMVGKYGAAVVTSGGSGAEEVKRYMLRFLRNLGCWTVGSISAEGQELLDPGASAQTMVRAKALGKKLVATAESGKTFPDQQTERDAFFERMKQLVLHRREEWPYEYEYWRSQGRL